MKSYWLEYLSLAGMVAFSVAMAAETCRAAPLPPPSPELRSPPSVPAQSSPRTAPSTRFAPSVPSAPPAPPAPFAVVELFTSEGCSSCPPADKLLSDLAAEAETTGKPVFTLSFHVDYWNYLGWADPFSRPEFTERQQRYAKILDGRVYTPQMIVNGGEAFIGSQGGTARRSIGQALEQSAGAAIALKTGSKDGGGLTVEFAVTGHREGDVLNLAVVEKGVSVPVKRGENGGRILKHENVVRAFRTVRLNALGQGSVGLEAPASALGGHGLIIAYAQKSGTLRTIGAARATL